jgi:hypothetical protein
MLSKIRVPVLPPLGKLAYCGSPTEGSVIVYATEQKRWARVPVQDVAPSPSSEPAPVWQWLLADRAAQSMLAILVLGLVLMVIGGFGFTRHGARATAVQPGAYAGREPAVQPPAKRTMARGFVLDDVQSAPRETSPF